MRISTLLGKHVSYSVTAEVLQGNKLFIALFGDPNLFAREVGRHPSHLFRRIVIKVRMDEPVHPRKHVLRIEGRRRSFSHRSEQRQAVNPIRALRR